MQAQDDAPPTAREKDLNREGREEREASSRSGQEEGKDFENENRKFR